MPYRPPFQSSGENVMQNVGLILYPGFQVLGLCMSATFEVANIMAKREVYAVTLLSEQGALVKSSAGFGVDTEPFELALIWLWRWWNID